MKIFVDTDDDVRLARRSKKLIINILQFFLKFIEILKKEEEKLILLLKDIINL